KSRGGGTTTPSQPLALAMAGWRVTIGTGHTQAATSAHLEFPAPCPPSAASAAAPAQGFVGICRTNHLRRFQTMKHLFCLAAAAVLVAGVSTNFASAEEPKVEVKPLVTNLFNPCGIAIQPETGHVFI